MADKYEFRFRLDVPKYIYPTGKIGEVIAEYFKRGEIAAAYCEECGIYYMPPSIYCPRCFKEITSFKPVKRAFLDMFTILRKDFYGNDLQKPIIYGFIRFELEDGIAEGGLIHKVEVDSIEDLEEGMEVVPVFREPSERRGLITDIKFFKPK